MHCFNLHFLCEFMIEHLLICLIIINIFSSVNFFLTRKKILKIEVITIGPFSTSYVCAQPCNVLINPQSIPRSWEWLSNLPQVLGCNLNPALSHSTAQVLIHFHTNFIYREYIHTYSYFSNVLLKMNSFKISQCWINILKNRLLFKKKHFFKNLALKYDFSQ